MGADPAERQAVPRSRRSSARPPTSQAPPAGQPGQSTLCPAFLAYPPRSSAVSHSHEVLEDRLTRTPGHRYRAKGRLGTSSVSVGPVLAFGGGELERDPAARALPGAP